MFMETKPTQYAMIMEATPNAVCDMEAKPNALQDGGDHGDASHGGVPRSTLAES